MQIKPNSTELQHPPPLSPPKNSPSPTCEGYCDVALATPDPKPLNPNQLMGRSSLIATTQYALSVAPDSQEGEGGQQSIQTCPVRSVQCRSQKTLRKIRQEVPAQTDQQACSMLTAYGQCTGWRRAGQRTLLGPVHQPTHTLC